MSFFGNEEENANAHAEVTNAPHNASLSHELIAGAAAFEAAKAYEKHLADTGKPDSHATAKEFMAAIAGGVIDRIVETKGLDFLDKEKAKRHAMAKTDIPRGIFGADS